MRRAAASGAPRTSRSAIALERDVSRANLRCAPKKVRCAADFDPEGTFDGTSSSVGNTQHNGPTA
jgi:hypothetical protein